MGVAKEKTHAAIEKLAWEFLIAPAANFKQQIWVSLLDITLSLLCNISQKLQSKNIKLINTNTRQAQNSIDNDFNTLFKTLPSSRNYFPAGVAGSIHSRLFPKSSLHFIPSSHAAHWLSKVPKEVVDGESTVWNNKGSITSTGFVKEAAEAYSNQFKNDTKSFLNARAEELVPGGLMVIILPSLAYGVAISHASEVKLFDLLGS